MKFREIFTGLSFVGLIASTAVCGMLLPKNIPQPDWDSPFQEFWSTPSGREFILYQAGMIGSFLTIPIVVQLARVPRQFTSPWKSGRQSGGKRYPWLVWCVPFLGCVAVTVATWATYSAVLVAFSLTFLVLAVGLQNNSIVFDEHGVIWAGSRFLWDQVESWESRYSPGTRDGEYGESHQLIVKVEDHTFYRDDVLNNRSQGLSEFFRKYVPQKEV